MLLRKDLFLQMQATSMPHFSGMALVAQLFYSVKLISIFRHSGHRVERVESYGTIGQIAQTLGRSSRQQSCHGQSNLSELHDWN